MPEYAMRDPQYFRPDRWTYIYDHSPLISTLEKYVDYDKLKPEGRPNARLIITDVNVLTAEPLTFDSTRQQNNHKAPPWHFRLSLARLSVGRSGIGSLCVGRQPLEQHAAEGSDGRSTDHRQTRLYRGKLSQENRKAAEEPARSVHRALDIMFSDKTAHNIKMLKAITRYLQFIEEL